MDDINNKYNEKLLEINDMKNDIANIEEMVREISGYQSHIDKIDIMLKYIEIDIVNNTTNVSLDINNNTYLTTFSYNLNFNLNEENKVILKDFLEDLKKYETNQINFLKNKILELDI